MTKLYPPITLHQVDQELKVTGYTIEQPIEASYADEDSGGNRFLDTNSFNEATHEWQASKVTLNVHKDSAYQITLLLDPESLRLKNAGKSSINELLLDGIDISSIATRLEVKTMCCRLTSEYGDCDRQCASDGVNEVFLKPEQPVTNPKKHCPTCGAKVKIVGENTLHYESIEESQDDLWDSLIEEWAAASLVNRMSEDAILLDLKSKFTIKRK